MVQSHEVDEFRSVLVIGAADVFDDFLGNILHLGLVVPQGLKQLHILCGERRLHAVYHVVAVVTTLTANVNGSETAQRHIGNLLRRSVNRHKATHVFACDIGFEGCLLTNPISTFSCDGFLYHFVAELDFKFRTVQTGLTGESWDIEFTLCPGSLLRSKSRRGKNEAELINRIKLLFQFFIGIHREAGSRYRNPAAPGNGSEHIISYNLPYIVINFH